MTPGPSATGSRLIAGKLGLTDRIFAGVRSRKLLSTVEAGLARVEESLAAELRISDTLADTTSRYLYEAGGKRIRPMLAILTAQLGEGATPDVIEAAAALEMTHLGSLYHDDVMDGADVRRGVPSAQTVWGNNIAILTGDLLVSRASQIMARYGERAIRLQADRAHAIRTAILSAAPGDVILIAGKGHETYQEIKGVKYPFDEKVVVRELLEEM